MRIERGRQQILKQHRALQEEQDKSPAPAQPRWPASNPTPPQPAAARAPPDTAPARLHHPPVAVQHRCGTDPCACMAKWLFTFACVVDVQTPAKLVCGRHVEGTVVS